MVDRAPFDPAWQARPHRLHRRNPSDARTAPAEQGQSTESRSKTP